MQEDRSKPRHFVLVHGAWAGGWAMQRLADRLTAAGHRVHAPTLSGLGERAHLADRGIDLSAHIADVAGEIEVKDLDRVVLVGASYAGLVITGAAEKVGDRLAALVYVDAFLPENGQSFADITGMDVVGALVEPPSFPPDPSLSDQEQAWIAARVTPQPADTLTEKLSLSGAAARVAKRIYVQATGWEGPFATLAERLRGDPAWKVYAVDCGHDIATLKPDELAEILLSDALD